MQIEEVLTERECLADMLHQMGGDLFQTAKTIVQQLKQDPASVKDYPYKDFCQRSIDRFAQAAKFQP
jgi:hypothetical protein